MKMFYVGDNCEENSFDVFAAERFNTIKLFYILDMYNLLGIIHHYARASPYKEIEFWEGTD